MDNPEILLLWTHKAQKKDNQITKNKNQKTEKTSNTVAMNDK